MSITVYTRTTCAPCRTLKHYLKTKGHEFIEKNVDEDPKHMDDVIKQTGFQMVPMTVINGEAVMGLNLAKINSLLTN